MAPKREVEGPSTQVRSACPSPEQSDHNLMEDSVVAPDKLASCEQWPNLLIRGFCSGSDPYHQAARLGLAEAPTAAHIIREFGTATLSA